MSEEYNNPRYEAYAKEHGKTPEQMLAHDEIAWPGGKMCGFMLWISDRWTEFCLMNPDVDRHYLKPHDHVAFDKWLVEIGKHHDKNNHTDRSRSNRAGSR